MLWIQIVLLSRNDSCNISTKATTHTEDISKNALHPNGTDLAERWLAMRFVTLTLQSSEQSYPFLQPHKDSQKDQNNTVNGFITI